MFRLLPAALLLALAACTPTMNWRNTAIDETGLYASFPCKPDKADRRMEFAPGRHVAVHAIGCEAGGASFVVLFADFGTAAELAPALAQWKQASLASARATSQGEQPFVPAGALGLAQSVVVNARGQRPDGGAVHSRAAYFARGTHAYQAVVYSPAASVQESEPFFAGLRFP